MCIQKPDPLSPYHGTYIYNFRAHHLILVNQFIWTALGEVYFSCFQHSLVACTFCIGLRPLGLSLVHGIISIAVVLAPLMLVRLYESISDITRKHSLIALPDLLTLTIFLPPLPQWILSLRWGSCVVDISMVLNSTRMYFDWLWFSIIVSLYCKENFP